MNRRRLLAVVPSLALAGCGTLTQQQAGQLQAIIAGAQAIETSLSANVPLLLAAVPLPAAVAADVRAALAALLTATNALAQAPTLAAGVPYVQAIEVALNIIVGIAAGLPLVPEPTHTALVVAALALPPLEAAVGLAVKDGTALAAAIKAKNIKPASAVTAGG